MWEGMVGQCDTHYQTPPLWKDVKYEYDGTVFSLKYANRGDLFEGLAIWKEEEYRKIQGTQDRAFILEFKVFNSRREKNLEDTVASALEQIDQKQYEADLVARGIPAENIRKYGFAFEGKKVLIG